MVELLSVSGANLISSAPLQQGTNYRMLYRFWCFQGLQEVRQRILNLYNQFSGTNFNLKDHVLAYLSKNDLKLFEEKDPKHKITMPQSSIPEDKFYNGVINFETYSKLVYDYLSLKSAEARLDGYLKIKGAP